MQKEEEDLSSVHTTTTLHASLMWHMHISSTFGFSFFRNKSPLCVPLMWYSNFAPTGCVIPIFLERKMFQQTPVSFSVCGRAPNSQLIMHQQTLTHLQHEVKVLIIQHWNRETNEQYTKIIPKVKLGMVG